MGNVQKVSIDEFAQLTLLSCHDNNKMSFIYFHSPSSLTSSDLWRTNIGPNNLASKEQVELHRAGTFPPQNRFEESELWVNWGRVRRVFLLDRNLQRDGAPKLISGTCLHIMSTTGGGCSANAGDCWRHDICEQSLLLCEPKGDFLKPFSGTFLISYLRHQ